MQKKFCSFTFSEKVIFHVSRFFFAKIENFVKRVKTLLHKMTLSSALALGIYTIYLHLLLGKGF